MKRARQLAIGLLVTLSACGFTPPFKDASGQREPRSVASIEDITLGGIPQRVWFRGRDRTATPLILLHGGPGAPESGLFRYYDAVLENSFLVVYWDQRGTGRSYVAARQDAPLTITRLLDDLDELIEHVGKRFGAQRVVLLGHSFGTVLGVLYALEHPGRVAAVVSASQVVAPAIGDQLAYRFVADEAARRDDRHVLDALGRLGPPPHDVDGMLAMDRWLERYGGIFYNGRLTTGHLIAAALATQEVTVLDLVYFGRGNRWSLEQLHDELKAMDLRGVRRLEVPVFLLEGRFDQRTPPALAAQWWNSLDAPCKRLVWFDTSAHNPPFEQPTQFTLVLSRDVRRAIRDNDACQGAEVTHVQDADR